MSARAERRARQLARPAAALLVAAAALAAEPPPLGSPSAIAPEAEVERIELPAGSELRERPDAGATLVLVLDQPHSLPLVDRAGGWARVRLGQQRLWVLVDPEAPAPPPPPPPPADLPDGRQPGEPDPRRIARALDILGLTEPPADRLASYQLVTDVTSPRLLELFAAVATNLPPAYAERYGLEVAEPRGAVVLFTDEDDFRRYEEAEIAVRALGAPGHAGNGVAALFVGRRAPLEVAPVLVHELTHLLNRQFLGDGLPPWLEEGLASDLAFARIDRRGRLEPHLLGGESRLQDEPLLTPRGRPQRRWTVHLTGARASLNLLLKAHARRQTEPLEQLVSMPLAEFLDPDRRTLHYVQSAFLVRYLIDGDDHQLGPGFRAYLGALRDGGGEPPLARALEVSWQELESGFAAWLRHQRL